MNRIIKGLNVLLLSVCTGAVANGKAVDENTAKVIGCNKLITTGAAGVSTPADLTTAYVATAQTGLGVIVDYYVFNVQGGIGFVMVSGDDRVIPILAYSSESSFDLSNMPVSAKSWIEGYQNQITAVINNNIPAQEGTAAQWEALATPKKNGAAAKTTTVSALLTTISWNQVPGYNAYCPGGSVTGCVATAMAQVMKFWNWPTVGAGSHTYTQSPNPNSYSAQTANFGNTAYGWSRMSKTAAGPAVDTLMFHCGVSVDMDYDPTESGAWVIALESKGINNAEFALKNYFHYKRSLRGIPRFGESGAWPGDPVLPAVTDAAWKTMLQTELSAGRPVLYSGAGADGGHCWVCDGFLADGTFHFNFGWGGLSNGQFTINSIAPPGLGTGGGGAGNNFNADQCAIIGIQPDSFKLTSGAIQMNAHLNCTTNSPSAYTPVVSVVTKVMNNGTTAFSGDFCVQVFDTLANLVATVQTMTGQTIAAGASTAALTFAPSSPMYGLVPSYYKLRLMYRNTGATTWTPVADNGVFINENGLFINNYQDMELATPISLSTGTSIKQGTALTVTANIANYEATNFNGNITAIFTNVTTGVQTPVSSAAPISDVIYYSTTGGPYTFTTPSVSVAPGTYTIAIQHKAAAATAYSYTGSDYHPNPVIVTVGYGLAGVTNTINAENIKVYPNPSSSVININMDGVKVSRITITDIQGRQVQELTPDAAQSIVTVPVNNYAAGIYFVNLFAGEEVVTKKIVVAK